MTTTQDEVYGKMKEILEDALGVDEDEVKPDASLFADLGAESIDVLDIGFRLEKEFGIKVEQSELFPEALFNDPQYVQDSKVTDAGMDELRKRVPYAKLDELDASRDVNQFKNAITVDTMVQFVQSKLSAA